MDAKRVVFRCPRVAWQFQTRVCSPVVNQGFMLDWRAKKCTYLNELDVRKPLQEYIVHRSEELRLYNLVENFDNIKPRLKRGFFKCISWLNGSILEVIMCLFWEKNESDPSNGTNISSSYLPTFSSVFMSLVHGLGIEIVWARTRRRTPRRVTLWPGLARHAHGPGLWNVISHVFFFLSRLFFFSSPKVCIVNGWGDGVEKKRTYG